MAPRFMFPLKAAVRAPQNRSSSLSAWQRPVAEAGRHRAGRVRRLVERAILGLLMTVAAFLVERRLRRALRAEPKPSESGGTAEIH